MIHYLASLSMFYHQQTAVMYIKFCTFTLQNTSSRRHKNDEKIFYVLVANMKTFLSNENVSQFNKKKKEKNYDSFS